MGVLAILFPIPCCLLPTELDITSQHGREGFSFSAKRYIARKASTIPMLVDETH